MPTLDHGDVTLTEPPWCAGHDGPAETRDDIHHTAPVAVAGGPVGLDVELVEFPYGAVPVPVSLYVELHPAAATLDPDGLRDLAAAFADRATLLRALAERLAALRAGGTW
ncbi:DUF6907 domain-containing protein [Streptomyces globosus]|uniref:DUF6907 domain-containing protein n=1 Tax=Streptomyces globosus TaxID=68209 RepID=UPI0036343630